MSFSLLSRPLSSTVVQLSKPFVTQAGACAACSGVSSSPSRYTAAKSTSAAREGLLPPNWGGVTLEKKEVEEECKSYQHLSDSNVTEPKESGSSMTPGEEKQNDLSFFGAEHDDPINHPSSTLFSRSFLPFQCPACAIERRAKLLRRQKNVEEASSSNPVLSQDDSAETAGEILCSSPDSHPDPSASRHINPSDSTAVASHSSPSSSYKTFLSLGARLTQRLCPQCVDSAINFSSRKSCQTDQPGERRSPSRLRDCAVGEDGQNGGVAEKKGEGVKEKDDGRVGSGRAAEESTVGEGEEGKEEESAGEGERKTREKRGGRGGGLGSRRAVPYHSPRGSQPSSSAGGAGVGGGDQEAAEENKRDVRSSLSCDLTLGKTVSAV